MRAAARPSAVGAKVVLYTSSDCWRGAGISFVAIARGLDAYGFRPHVVTLCDDVTREFDARRNSDDARSARAAGSRQRLRRFLRAEDAHVVLVDRAHDLRVGALATMGTRVKLLYRFNHFGRTPPTDVLTRIAYRAALSGQVFLSSSARKQVLQEIPFMRRVAPTDDSRRRGRAFVSAEPARGGGVSPCAPLGNESFLLAVGALSSEKRYPSLFDALRQLGSAAPQLIICGEGRDEPALRARADAFGFRVRFEGRLPQRELIGAYNACTALVHAGVGRDVRARRVGSDVVCASGDRRRRRRVAGGRRNGRIVRRPVSAAFRVGHGEHDSSHALRYGSVRDDRRACASARAARILRDVDGAGVRMVRRAAFRICTACEERMTTMAPMQGAFEELHRSQREPWMFGARAAEILRHEWIVETVRRLAPAIDVGCRMHRWTTDARLAEPCQTFRQLTYRRRPLR